MLKLVVEKGPREGDTHEFPAITNAVVKIGRVVRGNTIAFKEDAGISSKHLLIEFKSPKWLVSDLNSSNGTALNTSKLHPLTPTELSHGDVVKFGEYTSIKVHIVGSVMSASPPRRRLRARKEDGAGCDLGKKVAAKMPPARRGRPEKKARVELEGEEEVEEKVEIIELQPVNTRRTTRSSAKAAGSSNPQPSNQIGGDRPKRGGGRRKNPLPEVAEDVASEYAVCENVGENVVQSKQADEAGGFPEMDVSSQVGSRPKRARRKKPLPEVAEDVFSEYARYNARPPPVCENARENVVPNEQGDYVGANDLNDDDAGRSNSGLEEHQECGLEVKNVGIVPPTLSKQGRQTSTRRTRSSSINAGCSTIEGNEYLEMEIGSQIGSGAKRNKLSSEVVHNVSCKDAEVQNLGSPHVSENTRENIEQNGPREAVQGSDADKEDVRRSNLGLGENDVDFEQEPDLKKMTLGDWFDYLEVYLPKQIIKETEEIISSMKEKADQVYEYKLKHKNDQGKGKSAAMV